MRITKLLLLFSFFLFLGEINAQDQEKVTLSGYIQDGSSGEELINATLYIDELKTGVVSNVYGFYSITIPPGIYNITFSYLGFKDQRKEVDLSSNQTLNIELSTDAMVIETAVVVAETIQENVDDVAMSQTKMEITQIKKIPALMGEVDIIKAIQLLPGVSTIGEGTSGFYVRGGNVDQNLILLDEAPVYNASHLLGFFSVFNPDAIKDIQFYKGAMPAEYGGRLSSVVDIRMKEGNSKKFSGSAGIGTISSRLTLESPLGKKGSFMLSGRRTYADLFLRLSKREEIKDNILYFYDFNGKVNYRLSDKDRIYLSAYTGRDVLEQDQQFNMNWGNRTATLRWNHLFNQKLFSNLSLYASDYDYQLGISDILTPFEWTSKLIDYGAKYDFGAYLSPKSTLKFGIQGILHEIKPGKIEGIGAENPIPTIELNTNKGLEVAAYVAHEYDLTEKIKLNYGLRLSSFHNTGPQDVYTYDENYDLKDTISQPKGIYNSFYNLEPRVGLRFKIDETSSIKASYNRTSQNIHLASNSTSATPLDIWFMSGTNIKPQLADQYALGYFKNLFNNTVEASVEVYYKDFNQAIDFKDHAELFLNPKLEGELRIGKARSYGLELLLQKNVGKLTGWIAYTLAKTEKKIDDINDGNWYNAKYDKVHDLAIIASYEFTDRFSISGNWTYKTGNAVTFPTGKYVQLGKTIPIFSERNGERMPAYHRLDLGATYQFKKKLLKKADQELVVSIYNVYARKNAYSIAFRPSTEDPNIMQAEKTYLFSIIPAVTYNLKF